MSCFLPDILHVKHLGTDPMYFGSVMKMLTHFIIEDGVNPDRNLRLLFEEIVAIYKHLKITDRYHTLKHSMIHPNGKKLPQLKGRGAQVKQMGPVLLLLFEKYMDKGNPCHVLVLRGLKHSVRIDELLDSTAVEYRLPLRDAQEVKQHCFEFCRVNATLITHFHKQAPPVNLFNFTIKAHYLMHLGLVADYIHPSLGSCYQGETLMQLAKKLVRSSANGSQPILATNTALLKYSYALAHDFR
jgi:hypothetical protein